MQWLDRLLDILLRICPRPVVIAPDQQGVYVFFGRWLKEVPPGLYVTWPWCITMGSCYTTPRVVEFEAQSVTTKDGVVVAVEVSLAYWVQSARRALYMVLDFENTIGNALQGEIERYVAVRSWLECRDTTAMAQAMLPIIRKRASGWGLYLQEVYFKSFTPHQVFRHLGQGMVVRMSPESS